MKGDDAQFRVPSLLVVLFVRRCLARTIECSCDDSIVLLVSGWCGLVSFHSFFQDVAYLFLSWMGDRVPWVLSRRPRRCRVVLLRSFAPEPSMYHRQRSCACFVCRCGFRRGRVQAEAVDWRLGRVAPIRVGMVRNPACRKRWSLTSNPIQTKRIQTKPNRRKRNETHLHRRPTDPSHITHGPKRRSTNDTRRQFQGRGRTWTSRSIQTRTLRS